MTLALAGLAPVLLPTLLPAQTVGGTEDVKFRFDGLTDAGRLGSSVSGAGDVDGVPDLIVGMISADPNGHIGAGSAFVYSGATGARIFSLDDLAGGSSRADSNGMTNNGSALVFTFNTILTASAETFSVATGGTVDYRIDFPDVDAAARYRILLSGHGTGPTLFHGLLVPLQKDRIFLAAVNKKLDFSSVARRIVFTP